jgi:hypothetical protein
LAALVGDPLQELDVVALDIDEDRQLRAGIALVHLDLGVVHPGVKSPGWGSGSLQGSLAISIEDLRSRLLQANLATI